MLEFRLAKDFRDKKVRISFGKDIEPQEVFLDNLAQKKEKEWGISEKKFETPLSRGILKAFFLLVLILVLGLFSKTFQLQIFENKKLLALAEENKFIVKSLQASRGVIYDSKEKQIVFNNASFDLILNKERIPQPEEERKNIIRKISEIIKISPEDIDKKIGETKNQTILVSKNLDQQTLILLETKINEFPGFEIQRNLVRNYKDGEIFSHLVGYLGQVNAEELRTRPEIYSNLDYVGRDGIEKVYEEVLRKNPGKLVIERDALGNIISKNVVSLPESGESLVLWLDADLQKKISEELKKILETIGSQKAAAVALDPKTGGVMALVSIPEFDNNLFNKGSDAESLNKLLQDSSYPLFNRAITAQYSTGSTIKPLTATAALEEKIISPEKKINCQGGITIPNEYNPEIVYEYHDWTTHGPTDMRKAIAESCNVYFYTIGGGYGNQQGLGPSRIKKYLELFGWGNKTQIDLPGESAGFIPSPQWKKEQKKENWWDGDTYNLSIGQGGLAITPLQVASAFVAIANGGTLYQPQVVQKVIDNNKNIIEKFSPKILRANFVNPDNLKVVREGMRQTVTGENSPQASAVTLNSLPVKVAAKTGTAQTSKENSLNNWITVFAPYDDPQIVLTIVIENVKGVQTATVPAAKEILNWYFTEDKK